MPSTKAERSAIEIDVRLQEYTMGDQLHKNLCRVLSLDGGGAKGFDTPGALKEIEGLTGGKLCERFDLVFGTSTGAIIAALVGLGFSVDDMVALYRQHVVKIMGRLLPIGSRRRSKIFRAEVFGDRNFDAFKTNMGIVCTRWNFERPMIFKTKPDQAFAGKGTFVPGFGCTIGEAVSGSCSAYPFFKKLVTTSRANGLKSRTVVIAQTIRRSMHSRMRRSCLASRARTCAS